MLKKLMDAVSANDASEAAAPSAIELLKKDHREVEALFAEFEAAEDKREKRRVARQICAELDVHAQIEEKIFYPEVIRAIDELKPQIHEGIVEHTAIKRLIKEIPRMGSTDEFFEPKVKVLKEFVQHHVKEEETDTFKRVQSSDALDLHELGQRMQQRKERLQRNAKSSGKSNGRGRGGSAHESTRDHAGAAR